MFRTNEYCGYETCKKLCEIGFRDITDGCVTKYDSDYVYDNDPSHPESHKAGEVETFSFSYRNGDEEGIYSMPTLYEAARWLQGKYGYDVAVRRTAEVSYECRIYKFMDGVSAIIYQNTLKGSYIDALSFVVELAVSYVPLNDYIK